MLVFLKQLIVGTIALGCMFTGARESAASGNQCEEIPRKELIILSVALEEKLAELEPGLKGRAKFNHALLCGGIIRATYYTPEQSPGGPDNSHLAWDLLSSESSIVPSG